MKKNYFLMAAAATMFAACSQNDVLNEAQVQDEAQAIGFSTYANKATRAIDATNLENYHATFGVWTFKTNNDGTETVVMPNYVVAYNDNGNGSNDWDYDGATGTAAGQLLKYWDRRASYDFYAYAPYSKENVSFDAATGKISIAGGEYAANENIQKEWGAPNNNVFTGIGKSAINSTDWMIAKPITKAAGVNTLVEEQFSHTMSKLIVCFKTTSSFKETIKVNSVAVNNVHGSGKYNIDGNGWITTTAAKTITGQVGNIVARDANGEPFYSMEYLLIPSGQAPTFSVNYTINGDTYDVKEQGIASVNNVEAGTVYTVTVTISADPIHFDATVSDWSVRSQGSVSIE